MSTLPRISVVNGQAPRRQDLRRRDVLPRHHESWRQPPGSKNEFKSSRGTNVNFLQNKGQIIKKNRLNDEVMNY